MSNFLALRKTQSLWNIVNFELKFKEIEIHNQIRLHQIANVFWKALWFNNLHFPLNISKFYRKYIHLLLIRLEKATPIIDYSFSVCAFIEILDCRRPIGLLLSWQSSSAVVCLSVCHVRVFWFSNPIASCYLRIQNSQSILGFMTYDIN